MNKRKVSLEDFYDWYQENKIRLREDASKYSIYNEQLREEFLREWPLDRILTMSIDDYVIGKGEKNNSFCYALEIGKYQSLFMGIGGGGSSKFGIYWNEDTKRYKNQANKIIPESELEDRFNKLKSDLYEIIQAGRKLDFNNPIFDIKKSKNEFIGRSAVVTKLLCIYSEGYPFLGINLNSQKRFWNKLLPQKNQGGPYLQNHEICKLFSKTYPELEPSILGSILFEYSKYFIDSDDKQGEKEMSEQNNIHHPLSNILLQSKNLILRGAPGTGKTYLAKEIAKELTDGNEDQIGFIQFHPSYDYTDFVEGLRPVSNGDGDIEFKLQDGIFKEFCLKAKKNWLYSHKNKDDLEKEKKSIAKISKYFANMEFPSDKLYTKRQSSFIITEIDENYIYISIPENEVSKNAKLKIKDIEAMLTSESQFEHVKDITQFFNKNNATQEFSYYLTLYKMIKNESIQDEIIEIDNELKNFVFIIDEINRGEISKIFGELFFSIDPGYRGEKGSVSTQYDNLHETDEKFYIPENVYIIGTMNDIDRSVDTFDFAMRRRFRFIEITAESQLGMLDEVLGDKAEEAKIRLRNLNAEIEKVQELNGHYHIGPSYFLKLQDVDFDYELLWSDYLKPLLEDYLRGSYEEVEKLKILKKAFDLKENEQTIQKHTGDEESDENKDEDN